MKAIKRIIASVFVCMFAVTGGLNALAPVSYTHLDVYKRQEKPSI